MAEEKKITNPTIFCALMYKVKLKGAICHNLARVGNTVLVFRLDHLENLVYSC